MIEDPNIVRSVVNDYRKAYTAHPRDFVAMSGISAGLLGLLANPDRADVFECAAATAAAILRLRDEEDERRAAERRAAQ